MSQSREPPPDVLTHGDLLDIAQSMVPMPDHRRHVLFEQQLEISDEKLHAYSSSLRDFRHQVFQGRSGKRKLLLVEIEFLTLLWKHLQTIYGNNFTKMQFHLIYVGASSGLTHPASPTSQQQQPLNHVEHLEKLFDSFIHKFWYFDPRHMEFTYNNPKRTAYECLFGDEQIKFFNEYRQKNNNVYYILIFDCRSFVDYLRESVHKPALMGVANAIQHCTDQDLRTKLESLMKTSFIHAKELLQYIEKIIEDDLVFQENAIRALGRVVGASTKTRPRYYYPYYPEKNTQDIPDVPYALQCFTGPASTETRGFFIKKTAYTLSTVITKDAKSPPNFTETTTDAVSWPSAIDPSQQEETPAHLHFNFAQRQVDLTRYDSIMYTHNNEVTNREQREDRMVDYITHLYRNHMGAPLTPEQERILVFDHPSRQSDERLKNVVNEFFEQMTDFFIKNNNNFDDKFKDFLTSDVFQNVRYQLQQAKSNMPADEVWMLQSLALFSDVVNVAQGTDLHSFMQRYRNHVSHSIRNPEAYSNAGLEPSCPLYVQKFDMLTHLQLLMLIRVRPDMVTQWFQQLPDRPKRATYMHVLERLIGVYSSDTRPTLQPRVRGHRPFDEENDTLSALAKQALQLVETEDNVRSIPGCFDPLTPRTLDLNTKYWAVAFYNNAVLRLAHKERDLAAVQSHFSEAALDNLFGPYMQTNPDTKCKYLGQNPNWHVARWPASNPVLHVAAAQGAAELVQYLLNNCLPKNGHTEQEHLAYINQRRKGTKRGPKGYTALHLAAYEFSRESNNKNSDLQQKYKTIINMLLDHGADCNLPCNENDSQSKNETALAWIQTTADWKTAFPRLTQQDEDGEWQNASRRKIKLPPITPKDPKPRLPADKPAARPRGSTKPPRNPKNAIMALLQNLKASTF